MALSIVNNPLSIGAQGSVNGAQGSLSKTIKSLSTGLRINSASDDASGLAVSEKLRSQISGLSKAATNAQDAISMLQTAEGAMGSMNSMVQRIRELAVQAGDPAYTANDRAMLQLEVDQLKEEIDRVSTSTEFNTKKLLNGDAAAIWTASSDSLEAIVNGSTVEGNYKVTYSVDPGQNSVYKSNVMQLKGDGRHIVNDGGTGASFVSREVGADANYTITTATDTAEGTGLAANAFINGSGDGSFVVTGKSVLSGSMTLEVTDLLSGKKSSITVTVSSGNLTSDVNIGGITIKSGTRLVDAEGDINMKVSKGGEYSIRNSSGTTVNVYDTKDTFNFYDYNTASGTFVNVGMRFDRGIQTGIVQISSSQTAGKNTKLSDIANFTNSDGRMVLDNTQSLSIYAGNGNQVEIFIEGNDTVADLVSKLKDGLTNLGVADKENSHVVHYVTASGTGNSAVQGTMIIQGSVLGDDSNLSFVGDEALLKALGITQIQEAKNTNITATVVDAHNPSITYGSDTVSDGRLRGIIPGVDLELDPTAPVNVEFNTATATMMFTADATEEILLHIKDTSTKAAIGANEGQTLDLSIGRLDTKSLEITDVNIATFEDAQRSITQLDMALEKINKARSTAGAQMNRLEYTINNLNTTRENMTAAESRIRDLDIAQASSSLAAQQVLMQSASAMLAQANQMPSYAMQLIG